MLSLAVAEVPFADAVAVGARATSAVEFVVQENSGALLVVFCARSTAVDQSCAARFFERLARPDSVKVRYLDHDDDRLRKLARAHQLASLHLFGSAVRTDFRPGSDVDVLVRHRDGVRLSLDSIIGLELDLERAFGRDVDLIREENLRPELRERVRTEAVSLP